LEKLEGFGFRFFFVDDVISWVGFRPFWLRLPGPECQLPDRIFASSFYWKLGSNTSFLNHWLAF